MSFSLRMLLVVTTMLCAWIGVVANRANRQQRAVDALSQRRATIRYDYQAKPREQGPLGGRSLVGVAYDYRAEPPGPKWLRRRLGDKYFVAPESVTIDDQSIVDDGVMSLLRDLPRLESISISGMRMTNSDLGQLQHLRRLKSLVIHDSAVLDDNQAPDFSFLAALPQLVLFSIGDPRFGDRHLHHLAGSLGMRAMFLQNSSVSGAGLAHVVGMKELAMLNLARTQVADEGLEHLAELPKLDYLCLVGTAVTDAGLKHLARNPALKRIELSGTGVTELGVAELRASLPNCEISF